MALSHHACAEDDAARSDSAQPAQPFVDSNVSLFQWPFRRLPLDDSRELRKKLRALGFVEAWAGSFESVLHRDIAGVNSRLVAACREFSELTPIGSINVNLTAWENDLDSCLEQSEMPGVRLYPNYHGYALDDARFIELVKRATAARRFVQIAVAMEDTRTQHDLVRTADVDLTPLSATLRQITGARVQLLNYRPRGPLLDELAKTPGVFFDTARVESTDGVAKLLRSVPAGRVVFGSHSPFLIPEAALIRAHESGLTVEQMRAVMTENAGLLRFEPASTKTDKQ